MTQNIITRPELRELNDQLLKAKADKDWKEYDRLSTIVQKAASCPDCHILYPRVIGEDEQLTIIPLPEGGGLALYTLDDALAGTVTSGKD